MDTQQHQGLNLTSTQLQQPTPLAGRTRRPRAQPLSKQRSTTSTLRSSSAPSPHADNLDMAMSTPSGPHSRQPRRRSSAHYSADHVRSSTMNGNQNGPPVFTKTGRISKALKGRKVHECNHCGKVYSRAEHLRRHQNNHRTSPLRCRECGRQFYREDLLSRHIVKYGHTNSRRNSTLRDRVIDSISPRSSVDVEGPSSATSSTYQDSQPVRNEGIQQQFATGSSSTSTSISFPAVNPLPVQAPSGYNPIPDYHLQPDLYTTSPSPALPQPWICTAGTPAATATTLDPYNSYEPVPHTSIGWQPSISSQQSPSSNSPPIWDPIFLDGDMSQINGSSRSSPAPLSAVPPMLMPLSGGSLDDPVQDGQLGAHLNKERQSIYIHAYWRCFHPFFPILHKQQLQKDMRPSGKVLLAAMMAIGAQFTHEQGFAGSDSRILHERVLDALNKKKTELSPSSHLEILQSIVLLEFLSHFKAKRAPDGLSELFKSVYDILLQSRVPNDQAIPNINSLSDANTAVGESASQQWYRWIDLHCRERLLAMCFILDSRHALLLNRQNYHPNLGLNLLVPVSYSLWDASTLQNWIQRLRTNYSPAMSVTSLLSHIELGKKIQLEPYPSALMIACYAASTSCQRNEFSLGFSSHSVFEPTKIHLLSQALASHVSIRIMILVVQLISLVPFRALIATSGESWFFSKRLARDTKTAAEEFERLQHQMRAWTSCSPNPTSYGSIDSVSTPAGPSSFVQAVGISLQIVREATRAPEPPYLSLAFGPELALYFASLVLWAATYAGMSSAGRSPLKIEDDSDPFEWEPRRAEKLVNEFLDMAFSDVSAAQQQQHASPPPPSPPHTLASSPTPSTHHMLPLASAVFPHPHAPVLSAPPVSPPHAPLPGVLGSSHPPLILSPPTVPPASKLGSWRMGVGAILRWATFVLSAESAGHRNGGAGELIEGAIGVLEKVGRSGWIGPWF